jgi:hypothetical protein
MLRVLLALVIFCFGSAAYADPVYAPGLRIGLEPAGDLKPAPGVSGFQDPDRKTTVTIVEVPPVGYNSMQQALFGPAPAGATDITREIFSFQDGVGYLHTAKVVENGVSTKRWLLLTTPAGLKQDLVALINVNVPETASKIYSDDVVRKMLASTTIREPPIAEQLGLIPFKVDDLAGFRVIRVMPDSVLLVEGASDDISRNPYMVVTIGRASPQQLDDRPRFARDMLGRTPLKELTLQSADDMRIGGSPGFEIRGKAQSLSDTPVTMVQWVRFMGGGFIRIVGVSPNAQWDEMFGRFRTVRDGITIR